MTATKHKPLSWRGRKRPEQKAHAARGMKRIRDAGKAYRQFLSDEKCQTCGLLLVNHRERDLDYCNMVDQMESMIEDDLRYEE